MDTNKKFYGLHNECISMTKNRIIINRQIMRQNKDLKKMGYPIDDVEISIDNIESVEFSSYTWMKYIGILLKPGWIQINEIGAPKNVNKINQIFFGKKQEFEFKSFYNSLKSNLSDKSSIKFIDSSIQDKSRYNKVSLISIIILIVITLIIAFSINSGNINSIKKAEKAAKGTWIISKSIYDSDKMKITFKNDGTFEIQFWGNGEFDYPPKNGTWKVEKGKYSDTGKDFYQIITSYPGPRELIFKNKNKLWVPRFQAFGERQ